ncbi:flagellar hook capping protein [Paramagnetospirillum kuznetsovii]|uniref:Basal-body rod modification protein FlgD n=1 Tax=Paramagnetospirillum kuznetsovii TaxID=2053833 RepID=A0A364NX52_9PROT|nr:flagellar hook capping FlgD N-terminal domain-containing protein [Paramagnetospirillum kuznetsovii]RAU21633.1 flagellar hook capping protein [Paramagnetospirillum kuznetsovii]
MTTAVDNSAANAASAANSASTSKSTTAKATLGTNFNTFLNMLTTQLKHQDPLSPMDSTQFTNQLVQFSSVEQQINANSNLEKLIKLQTASQTAQAISYVGQTVEVAGSTLPLQNSSGASFSYTLPSNASSCEVQIKDSTGNIVYKSNAETSAGRHELTWDGTDTNGTTQKGGLYTINVVAKGSDGAALAVSTTVTGSVTKLSNDATNGATLELGAGTDGAKVSVTPDQVLAVTADTSLVNAQLTAANAQYQAALAQYNALKAAEASNNSSSSSTTTGQ